MDFTEPTDLEIKTFAGILGIKRARIYLIKRQFTQYEIYCEQVPADIVRHNGNVLFIDSKTYSEKIILLKDGQYYLMDEDVITPITPLSQHRNIKEIFIDYYFTLSKNLGNAIYIKDSVVDDKYLHKLIYFNEECKLHHDPHELLKLGNRLIKPFCDSEGNIEFIDNMGDIVPYNTIECPGEDDELEIDNDQFKLVIRMAAYPETDDPETDYYYTADYTAKSQLTKAAARTTYVDE